MKERQPGETGSDGRETIALGIEEKQDPRETKMSNATVHCIVLKVREGLEGD